MLKKEMSKVKKEVGQEWAIDDVTGETLDLQQVKEARKEEVAYIKE